MESLRRRIEDLLLHLGIERSVGHWSLCRTVDRIIIEVENEFAERQNQKGTTNKSTKEPELPL
jgi:hypothetical protein